MRSSAEATILAAALALGGCSHGRLPDAATAPAAQVDPGPDAAPAGMGATYAPPTADQPPTMPPPRYDNVGYAVWSDEPGPVSAAHRSLPPGSFAEVTSLDTGKTILVPVTGVARPGREIELSGAAAQALGLSPGMKGGVRVRAVNPGEADLAALRAGQPAAARPDTPPVLLNPLRRKLGGMPAPRPAPKPPIAASPRPSSKPPVTASPRPAPPPRAATPAAGAGYYVQIAALSDAAKARALARSVGGTVVPGGGFYRIRTGPYADAATAQRARDAIARRGYGEARIVRPD